VTPGLVPMVRALAGTWSGGSAGSIRPINLISEAAASLSYPDFLVETKLVATKGLTNYPIAGVDIGRLFPHQPSVVVQHGLIVELCRRVKREALGRFLFQFCATPACGSSFTKRSGL
jgi:hypothetical protein